MGEPFRGHVWGRMQEHGGRRMSKRQEEMGSIRSTIRMMIPLNRQSEALEILGAVSEQIKFDPSCISSRLYRGVDEACAIMVDDIWKSDKELMRYLRSDVFHRVLLVVEMAQETPEIRFDTIMHSSGIETIENARN
jgi:quinol monooxygenase YgiN